MKPSRVLSAFLALCLLIPLAGCGSSTCIQLQDTRAAFNVSLDAIHTAHSIGALAAKDEAVLMPSLRAVAAALDAGDGACIAEQQATAAGDKSTAQTWLAKATTYLKAAKAGLSAYVAAEPPNVKAIRASKKSTAPPPTTRPSV
jgi:hypothetical protein